MKPTLVKAVTEARTPRLQPPVELSDEQKSIWRETVEALPPDWFAAEHGPLLRMYVGHVDRATRLEQALGKLDPADSLNEYERMGKLLAVESAKALSLARAMRITQQARLKPETAHNRGAAAAQAATLGPRRPWDTGEFSDEDLLAM